MDQFTIELPESLGEISAGEDVVIFGDASTGAPTADDWGTFSQTIGYEIVTRIGNRIPRNYQGSL